MFENHNLADIVTPVNVEKFKMLLLESGYDQDKSNYLLKGFSRDFLSDMKGLRKSGEQLRT